MAKYLSIEEILRLHFQVVEEYGGSHGVRDESRLASVEQAPKQKVFGVEQYGTLHEKAAVYTRNIISDHPFNDGNKRTGITVTGVFLLRNGVRLTATPKDLEDFAVSVATNHLDVQAIATWFEAHSILKSKN